MDISVVLGALGDYFETSGKNDQLRESARLEADLYSYKKQLDIDTAVIMAQIADENDNKEVARRYKADIAKIEREYDLRDRNDANESGRDIKESRAKNLLDPEGSDWLSIDDIRAGNTKSMSMTDRKTLAEANALEQSAYRTQAMREYEELKKRKDSYGGVLSSIGAGISGVPKLTEEETARLKALDTYLSQTEPYSNPETGWGLWMKNPNAKPTPFQYSPQQPAPPGQAAPPPAQDPKRQQLIQQMEKNRAAAASGVRTVPVDPSQIQVPMGPRRAPASDMSITLPPQQPPYR